MTDVLDRFFAKVKVGNDAAGCWEWLGARDCGYGRFHIGKRKLLAHRVAYEAIVGAIPDGLMIDHLCRNRACVNPLHMEPVTAAENSQRGDVGGLNSRKTHCPQGHAYDEANTYWYGTWRHCRKCDADRKAQRKRIPKEQP